MASLAPVLGLLTAACWGTADYLSRSQSEKVGYYRTTVYMHVTTLFALVVIAPFLQTQFDLQPLSLLILTVAGTVNFFGFIFLYKAFHRGVVSIVAPIAYTYPAVTAVLAVALLGAVLTASKTLSIIAIIAGVILLSTRLSELRGLGRAQTGPSLSAGVIPAVLAALSFGAVYVGVGYVTPIVGFVLPILMLRAVGTGVGFGIAPMMHESVSPNRASLSRVILIMGVLESVGFLSFNYGVSLGASSLPIVAAVSGMGGAVATLYAVWLLRERLEANQLAGLVLSFAGVFTLLYLGG